MTKDKRKVLLAGERFFDLFLPMRIAIQNYCLFVARKNIKFYPQVAMFSFDSIGISINLEGRYEKQSLCMIKKFLDEERPGVGKKVALDIGANIGNHSLFFSEFFDEVYSFEPNPRTFAVLNVNGCFNSRRGNIKCRNYGLSDIEGSLPFKVNELNVGGSSIIADGGGSTGGNSFLIDVKRADDIDELRDKEISLIKIDVEGHELRALSGAKDLLKRNKPVILFEQYAAEINDGTSPTINFLGSLGYEFASIRRSFYFGEGAIHRIFSLLLRAIFGARLSVEKTSFFEKKFYDMIIAIPKCAEKK